MIKKRERKINKWVVPISATFALMVASLFIVNCGGRVSNRSEVVLELPAPHSLNFDQYKLILYKDVSVEGIPKGYSPEKELKTFFIEDMGRITKLKVERWDRTKHGEMVPGGVIVVSGKLKLDIKSRSKIETVKKEGKKKSKKAFVTVQHWELILDVTFKDISTGKEIFNHNFNAKLANADAESVKFNFEKLFYKITSNLVKRITRTKKMQRRNLLL